MRTKKIFGISFLFLCMACLVGCNDQEGKKEIYSLSFEKEYYEIPCAGKMRMPIRGGNRDYSVSVENPDLLEVVVDLSDSVSMGTLVVNPKLKGQTTVTIRDNVTHESVDLKMKVIDGYLVYAIKESNHPALSAGIVVYLINNENRDCYLFNYNYSVNTLNETLISKGTYKFFLREESGIDLYPVPYMTLNYVSDEHGNFTDAAIPPIPHHLRFEIFDGITSVDTVMNMIQTYLGVDWKKIVQEIPKGTKNEVIQPILKTTIDNTNYTIIGTFDTIPVIPEHVLE